MAKVTGEFQSDVIRAFKGTLDFYYWRGIPVVRGWPRKPVLPRSPAVQSAGQDWRDNSQALSSLPLSLQLATADEVKDTSYTWKDAWTSAIYGHGVTWGNYSQRPPVDDQFYATKVMALAAAATLNVNNTNYVALSPLELGVDFSVVPYTHFRIRVSGQSNQAGQTVTLQMATGFATPGTPVHAGGNDLVVTNTAALFDSGWRTQDLGFTTAQNLILGIKGSNGTVDLSSTWIEVWWKYDP